MIFGVAPASEADTPPDAQPWSFVIETIIPGDERAYPKWDENSKWKFIMEGDEREARFRVTITPCDVTYVRTKAGVSVPLTRRFNRYQVSSLEGMPPISWSCWAIVPGRFQLQVGTDSRLYALSTELSMLSIYPLLRSNDATKALAEYILQRPSAERQIVELRKFTGPDDFANGTNPQAIQFEMKSISSTPDGMELAIEGKDRTGKVTKLQLAEKQSSWRLVSRDGRAVEPPSKPEIGEAGQREEEPRNKK